MGLAAPGLVLALLLTAGPQAAGPQAAVPQAPLSPCTEATTTFEMADCLARQVRQAEQRLEQVLAAAQALVEREQREARRPAALEGQIDLAVGQRLWLAYRRAHCDAISRRWSGASLRPVIGGECLLRLTRQRSHELWSAFLTFPDGTPPLLPDPTAPEPTAAPASTPRQTP